MTSTQKEVYTSVTPELEKPDPVALGPENIAALGGITIDMLRKAELALQMSSNRDKHLFDEVIQLRSIVGAYGWQ